MQLQDPREKSEPSHSAHACLRTLLVTPESRVKRVLVQLVALYESAQKHEENVSEKYMQPIRIMKIADGLFSLIQWVGRKCASKQSSSNVYITIHCYT